MSDELNICLPCGLCCDGTLIGFVQLDSEEISAIREVMEIEEEQGHGFFLQPCAKFIDCCTIYHSRPKQCANYKCELLLSVERNELDFDSAIEIIDVIKHKRIDIENQLSEQQFELKSQSFYFKMVELKNLLHKNKSESSLTLKQIELLSDIDQLESLLSKRFGLSFLAIA